MANLTNDRAVTEIQEGGPMGYKAGNPANFQTYYGQMIVQTSDTGAWLPAQPTVYSMTASVVVGLSQQSNYNITSTQPLRTPYLQVRFGVFDMLNDSGNPVTADTLPNTLLFASDDQTVSLSSNSGARPIAGRLWTYNASDPYPVKVLIGVTPSGSIV